jgi:prepilin-type N-terminal cleavage/methylation domain-containing protein
MPYKEKKRDIDRRKGMTTFELIVVIAIIGILTSISVAQYRNYEQQNALANLARDIALTVRLAQSYGLNVRGQGGGDNFQMSYGVSFNEASPTEYFIFRNSNRRNAYVNGGVLLERLTLGGGYRIQNVCLTDGLGDDCWNTGAGGGNEIDIVFDRPKPDAFFFFDGGQSNYTHVTITLTDPKGTTKDIIVRTTGYVSVQ